MPTPDQQARWLEPGQLVTLYELDLTAKFSAFTGLPGPILYFHQGTDPVGSNNVFFRSHIYVAFPIKGEGFEWSTRGTLPRPKLTVSNMGSITSALLREYDDCIGATIIQRHTFSNFLDNGADHGPPYMEFTPQIFVVDRKTAETNTIVTFDLATGMDAEGILLPRRQILATACPWTYRGAECSYAAPVAGGSGWPVYNRLGKQFGPTLTNCTLQTNPNDSNRLTLLTCATGSFFGAGITNDVGKNIGMAAGGTNVPSGTLITAIYDASNVGLNQVCIAGTGLSLKINRLIGRTSGGATSMPLAWDTATTYSQFDVAYITVSGIRVYAVSKVNSNINHVIYNENYWMLDTCLKKLSDCENHFGALTELPYGGMPGASKLSG